MGCSGGSDGPSAEPGVPLPPPASPPFQELYDQGVDRYLGVYSPMAADVEGAVTNHRFGAGDGPLCLDGGEFTMATRDSGSADLMIFLQGGGACWSDLCLAAREAQPGIPAIGVLDPGRADNPVADWNTVYVPYCDGSLHAGDADIDSDGDGTPDRFQRGLHNLSAALDVAVTTFPAPRRILLTGSSAGGFGTTYAMPLVRKLYPDVPVELINDSGIGIGRPGEPGFTRQLLEEWNAEAFYPASCETCLGEDGHTTDLYKYQLEEDPDLRIGLMSHTRDRVIAVTFAGVGGEAFEAALLGELDDLEGDWPRRVKSFVAAGEEHTFLLGDLQKTAGDVTVANWIESMLLDAGWETARD